MKNYITIAWWLLLDKRRVNEASFYLFYTRREQIGCTGTSKEVERKPRKVSLALSDNRLKAP